LKVLIAEDEEISRHLLQRTLIKWGYEVVTTENGEEALEVLKQPDAPKFAIVDWMMPQKDGIEVCREVRETVKERYVYIILLTAKRKKEDIVKAMNAGADDYMTKPFDPCELEVRMRAGMRILDLQEKLISTLETLKVQATHDPLTGLYNRGAILDILRRELARCERGRLPIAVMMADLDRFKQINDAHGHLTGDAVLCEAAKRMNASVRPYDSIGRYGGEEFLVVMPECDEKGVLSAAERLRACINGQALEINGGEIQISISIGATATRGAKRADTDSLIRLADEALYRAKENGRDRVELNTLRNEQKADRIEEEERADFASHP
jgi:two-component system cell cycle response regulator